MTKDPYDSLSRLAKEMLFHWFAPGRAGILTKDASSIIRLLDLGSPAEKDDPVVFYERALKTERANFFNDSHPRCSLLDRNLAKLCGRLHLDDEERQVLRYFCVAEVSEELKSLTKLLEHSNTRSFAAQVADCLQLSARRVFRLLSQKGKLIQAGLILKHRLFPAGRPGGNSFSMADQELAIHLVEGQFDPGQITAHFGTNGKASQLNLDHFAHIKPTLDILIPYLDQSLEKGRAGVNVLIHGAPGTGKTELSRLLGQVIKSGTFEPSFLDEEGDPISGEQRLSKLRCTLSFLKNEPTLLVCDEAEDLFQDPGRGETTTTGHKLWVHRLLEENEAPIIWLSNTIENMDPATLRRFDFVVELPIPGRRQRQKIIQESVGRLVSDSCVKNLADDERLAPASITSASRILKEVGSSLSESSREAAFEHLLSLGLEAHGKRGIPPKTMQPEVNYAPELAQTSLDLQSLMEGLRSHPEARICLEGPPGTGKTAFGDWLAHSLDRPLHVHRISDLSSMFVGETEKQVARAFQKASSADGILMFDEIDSLLADRNGGHRSWEVSQVNEMLTQMEGYRGILIATTNRMSSLDPASCRRFDLTISFDYLDSQQLQKIFTLTCAHLNLPSAGEVGFLADIHNATPGDFAALSRQHRFRPFPDGLAMAEALHSLCSQKMTYQSSGKIGFKPI